MSGVHRWGQRGLFRGAGRREQVARNRGVLVAHNFVESAELFPNGGIHQNPLGMTTGGEHAMEVELVDGRLLKPTQQRQRP